MIKAGIIDPAKVTRSALQNAASIAGLFLTTEAVIADKPGKKEKKNKKKRKEAPIAPNTGGNPEPARPAPGHHEALAIRRAGAGPPARRRQGDRVRQRSSTPDDPSPDV